MFKLFVLAIFLSVSLIEVKAKARLPEPDNRVLSDAKDQEVGEYHHRRHHHHHHNHHHGSFHGKPAPLEGHPPGHEVMSKLWPIMQSLMNRQFNKNGRIDSSDNTKLEAVSKARALVKSKIHIKSTETELDQWNGNVSKQLVKTVDQNSETDAIVDFDSNMDVINDKVVKAKSEEEVNPIRGQNEPEQPQFHIVNDQDNNLRRKKRETDGKPAAGNQGDAEGKKTWDNISNAFKKVGDAIKDGFKKHIEEPVKKFVDQAKTKVKEWQDKSKKSKEQGKSQGDSQDGDQQKEEEIKE